MNGQDDCKPPGRMCSKTMEYMRIVENLLVHHMPYPFEVGLQWRGFPVPDAHLDPFLRECHRRRLYEFFVMAAVCSRRTYKVFDFDGMHIVTLLNKVFWSALLWFLVSRSQWTDIAQALVLSSHHIPDQLCEVLVTKMLHFNSTVVYHMLLGVPSRSSFHLIHRTLSKIVYSGRVRNFEDFIYSPISTIRHSISELVRSYEYLSLLVSRVCFQRLPPHLHVPGTDYEGCLTVAHKAGLFSLFALSRDRRGKSPLHVAVGYNEPDIVRLLCDAGAASNHEIFEQSRNPDLASRSSNSSGNNGSPERAKNAKEILDFLKERASQPSSLQDLCFLEVSRHVGWGYVRKSNVDQLPLPSLFKRTLEFS